jgi:large subunit ribosomal protein L25
MSDAIVLKTQPRDILGKKVKQLRNAGQIPAVIHDHAKDSEHVSVEFLEMSRVWQKAGKHHMLELQIGDRKQLAIIKDVDIEPKKYELRHVVFNAVSQNEKIEAEVPLVIDGDSPAEKQGLIVLHQLTEVEIKALPKNLPDKLTVDGTKLVEIGDKLSVADILVPEGVEIVTEESHPVATVVEPRAHVEEVAEAEEAEDEEGAAAEEKSEDASEEKSTDSEE